MILYQLIIVVEYTPITESDLSAFNSIMWNYDDITAKRLTTYGSPGYSFAIL